MYHQHLVGDFNKAELIEGSLNARQISVQQFFQFGISDIAGRNKG